MSTTRASAHSAACAQSSVNEATISSPTAERGADRQPADRVAQIGVVAAGDREQADLGEADDAVGEREGEAEVAERLRHAERAQEQSGHGREDDQPHRIVLRIDHARQPRVADPRPP